MKILALVIGIFLFLGIGVFAQNITLVQPGLLPDNPFHGFQDFFEQLQLFFTFSPQDKANVHLQLAEKRLAEMNLALQENKTDLVHALSQDYENEMNQTNTEIDNAKGLGQNVTALAQHVAEETFKHQLILENVLNKVPDEAKFAIENAINASSNGHNQAIESIFESRNVTGLVNVTFTIDNQTFTQTFNITSEHGKPHIEREHNENETQTTTSTTTTSATSTSSSTFSTTTTIPLNITNQTTTISSSSTTTSTIPINVTNQTSTTSATSTTSIITTTSTSQSPKQPTISEISPSSGPVGTMVTISGSHFTTYSNIIRFAGTNLAPFSIGNFSSTDGTTLQFTIPLLNSTSYVVTVMNSNGTSNDETFTVS